MPTNYYPNKIVVMVVGKSVCVCSLIQIDSSDDCPTPKTHAKNSTRKARARASGHHNVSVSVVPNQIMIVRNVFLQQCKRNKQEKRKAGDERKDSNVQCINDDDDDIDSVE